MSRENAAWVHRVIDLWTENGFEASRAVFEPRTSPDFEYLPLMVGELEGKSYRGTDAVAAWHREMLELFAEIRPFADEVIDRGEHILVWGHTDLVGRKSGVPGELRWAQLFEFRDEMLVSLRTYPDVEAALRAAGLAPEPGGL